MSRSTTREPNFRVLSGSKPNQRSGEVITTSQKTVPRESTSSDAFFSAEAQKRKPAATKASKSDSKKSAHAKIVETPADTTPKAAQMTPVRKKKIVKVKKKKAEVERVDPALVNAVGPGPSAPIPAAPIPSSLPATPQDPRSGAKSNQSSVSDSGVPIQQNSIIRRKVSKRERNILRALGTHAKDEAEGLGEYFVDKDHKICTSVVLVVLLCALRFALVTAAILFTAFFRSNSLNVRSKAVGGDSKLLTTLNAVSMGVYVVGTLLVLGDIFIIVSSVMRRMRPMAFSLVALHVTGFIGMCISVFIISIGYHRAEISSSVIGNVGFNKSHDIRFLETMGGIQQGLQCCGFNQGTSDWIRSVMIEWNEPLSEEWRQVRNSFSWQAECSEEFVCVAPKTCCVKMEEKQCNEASISRKEYDDINRQDFSALPYHLKPRDENAMFRKGCATAFSEAIGYWAFSLKLIAIFMLILWIFLTMLLVLTIAEVDGLGKVQVKHKKVNPYANKDLVPLTHRVDRALPFMKKWTVKGAHGKVRLGEEVKRVRRRRKSSSSSSVSLHLPKINSSLVDSCSSAVADVK